VGQCVNNRNELFVCDGRFLQKVRPYRQSNRINGFRPFRADPNAEIAGPPVKPFGI